MSKFVVDEFVIELGLSDKITKGLGKLEKVVNTFSGNIERKLNGAFSKDFTRPANANLNRFINNALKEIAKIDKALNGVGARGFNSRAYFKSFRDEAAKAAKEANKALNGVGRGLGGNGRPPRSGGGSGGSGSGNPPAPAGTDRFMNRLQNSSAFSRLQGSGGATSIRAQEIQARAAAQLREFSGDLVQSNRIIQRYNQELRELEAETRAQARASREAAGADRREARGSGGGGAGGRISGGFGGLTGAVAKGNLIVQAVEAVAETLSRAVEKGYEESKERAQTATMLKAAVGAQNAPEMQAKISDYANRYGLDRTETTQEYAKNRAVFSQEKVSNADLLNMMEQESVFAHASGVSNEGVKKANVAIAQIAGSNGHINKQDLNQLGSWIPEYSKVIAAGMGTTIDKVKAGFKTMKPDDFVKAWQKGLKTLNEQSGAAAAAQENLQAAEGRVKQAVSDDLAALFQSSGDGFTKLLDGVAKALELAVPYFEYLGSAINKTVTYAQAFSDWVKSVPAAFDAWKKSLPPGVIELVTNLAHAIDKLCRDSFLEMGMAIDYVKEKIKQFWDWVKGNDSNVKTSERYGSSVEAGGGVERFLDWLNNKAAGVAVTDSKYAANRDYYGGLSVAQQNQAILNSAGGYKPNPTLFNSQTAQTQKQEFTIPDKVIKFSFDINGQEVNKEVPVRDIIQYHQESQNIHSMPLQYDFSTPQVSY